MYTYIYIMFLSLPTTTKKKNNKNHYCLQSKNKPVLSFSQPLGLHQGTQNLATRKNTSPSRWTENHGFEKRTPWFRTGGYLPRCICEKVPNFISQAT